MKPFIILLIILKVSLASAQKDTTMFYYDKDWNEIKNKKNAVFFGKGFKINDGRWKQIDYYARGKVQMIGYYKDPEFTIKDGKFEYFRENGMLEMIETYKNDEPADSIMSFYNNGQVEYLYIYDRETHKRTKEFYYKEDGSESIVKKPEFQGEQTMKDFINSKLRYPEVLRRENIEGEVTVSFQVKEDGSVDEIEIFKRSNPAFEREAIRIIKLMPTWKPATKDGKPMSFQMIVPVFFKLAD
ncbi:TonB family protein [Emticicia fontis]